MTMMSRVPENRHSGPLRFARILRRAGPIAIKVGQHLALRPDLLPREYCDALLDLMDHATPFPWDEAAQILEADLGSPAETLFAWIDSVPFAAGSMAQVHRARTFAGSEVAVKVRRPQLERQITRNLRRLRLLLTFARGIGAVLPFDTDALAEEVETWLRQEIDFLHEADNARRLRALVADSPIQKIPRVHDRLSSARVLTYEFIEGVALSKVLKHLGSASDTPSASSGNWPPARIGEELENLPIGQFFRNLVDASLQQMFELHFFHADLHPGNLLILPDGRVGFLDFGLCDSLDSKVRSNQARYLAAVHDNNQPGMFQALRDLLINTEESDLEGLARDFDAQFRRVTDDNGPTSSSNLINLINAARHNRFQIPTRILSLSRNLMSLDRIAASLGRSDDLHQRARAFFTSLRKADFLAMLCEKQGWERLANTMVELTRDGPMQGARILADLSEGNLHLKVEVVDSPRMIALANRRARLWTAALLSICVAFLLTMPDLPVMFGYSLKWGLAAILLGLFGLCAVLWRRL